MPKSINPIQILNKVGTGGWIAIVISLNVAIYIRAFMLEADGLVFAECARNSGRVSAGINLMILFAIGHFGLKGIFINTNKRRLFQLFIGLFAINHLIHFFFVWQNISGNSGTLDFAKNIDGVVTFAAIVLLPLILVKQKQINSWLYFAMLLHFFNVTYFFIKTFNRVRNLNYPNIHKIGSAIMIGALFYILYRVVREVKGSSSGGNPL